MTVYAAFYGGVNYATPNLPGDLERFPSIQAAKDELARREWDSYYPCIGREEGTEFHLFLGYSDPLTEEEREQLERDPYPSRILRFGPRGGIQEERV